MTVFPLVSLIAGFYFFHSLLKRWQPGETARWRTAWLYAIIAWGVLVVFSSEVLGCFNLLRKEWVGGFWLVVFFGRQFWYLVAATNGNSAPAWLGPQPDQWAVQCHP